MTREYVKLNIDVPGTKNIVLKRGMEWPVDEAPDIVRQFAGLGPDKIIGVIGDSQICDVFSKEEEGFEDMSDSDDSFNPEGVNLNDIPDETINIDDI